MYVNTKIHTKINEFINLRVILFLSAINGCAYESAESAEYIWCKLRKSPLMSAIIGMFVCSLNLKDVN